LKNPIIITHIDLDGVAAAAVYCRLKGCRPDKARIMFAEPETLPRILGEVAGWINGETLVISDLGPNAGSFENIAGSLRRIVGKASEVQWFDHHVWEEKWIERIKGLGVKLYVDRDTCATGVVARHVDGDVDEVTLEIVRATCAADMWLWDHPLAPKLFRIIGRYRGAKGDQWNRRILSLLAQGVLWSDELQEVLEEYVDLELKGYVKGLARTEVLTVNGCKVAILAGFRGPPGNSLLAAYILSRTGADIAVITRRYSSLSLRSRRIDVRRIAVELGGGGHPAASGAMVAMPLHVRLLGMIIPFVKKRWFKNLVRKAVRRAGCIPQ